MNNYEIKCLCFISKKTNKFYFAAKFIYYKDA